MKSTRRSKGISDAVWPCRTEILDLPSWPLIILDGAHNDASLKALRETTRDYSINSPDHGSASRGGLNLDSQYVLIIGGTEGHEYEAMARELASSAVCTIGTQSRHPKSVPASRIARVGFETAFELIQRPSVDTALLEARKIAGQRPEIGLIIVTGSLFIAAEAREYLLDIEPEIYEDLKQPYVMPYENVVSLSDKIG